MLLIHVDSLSLYKHDQCKFINIHCTCICEIRSSSQDIAYWHNYTYSDIITIRFLTAMSTDQPTTPRKRFSASFRKNDKYAEDISLGLYEKLINLSENVKR